MSTASRDPSARLADLEKRRARLHRIDPPRPLRGGSAAVAAFVKERGIVVATGRSSLPMLAEAIVGHPIAGSWMADPEAHRIYKLLGTVEGPESATLVLGKATLFDPALAPAVVRVATDHARRDGAIRDLPPLARRLLGDVKARGAIRMDRWHVPTSKARPVRSLLERLLLVTAREMHTETGAHTTVVEPWEASDLAHRNASAARRLGYDAARDTLLIAAARAAVVSPEREARRWFPFEPDRFETLVLGGRLERLSAQRSAWLTLP